MASILANIGLSIIFPWYNRYTKHKNKRNKFKTENCDENNNPSISVNFGAVSKRLNASSLETAKLNCSFGALEIFFDQVTLNPAGAEIAVDCSFGAIVLFIPKEWCIIDRLNCSLGGLDIDKSCFSSQENAPKLMLVGNVSFGGIEVKQL